MAIPKKITDRLKSGIKQYQGVLRAQLDRDVSEADTVTVIKDILSDVFGYDKYAELTEEQEIRGTYCDLAVKLNGQVKLLLEVKAIGITLNDRHVKQAIDYAANEGIEWVVLTNGITWKLFRLLFRKPIDKELVLQFEFLELNPRSTSDLEILYLLCKRGINKSALKEYHSRRKAINRYMLAAILTNSDAVLGTIRREVRKISDVKADVDEITAVLRDEVIKRESQEGNEATAASRAVTRANKPKTTKSKVRKVQA